MIGVEPLTNSGVRSIADELRNNLATCTRFSIASAFIGEEGIQLLSSFLRANKSKNRIGRIIVSLYKGFNSRKNLRILLNLVKESNGRLLAAIANDTGLHWKFYYFESKRSITIFNGSANLTGSGIVSGNELLAKISLSGKERESSGVFLSEFEKQWSNSTAIANFPIEKYRESLPLGSSVGLHPDIRKLLAAPGRKLRLQKLPISAVILVRPSLSARTEKAIYETQSKWEKQNWDIYSVATKREFDFEGRIGIQMLLIEKANRKYSFSRVQVMDTTILKTEDGRYFIAYCQIGKKSRSDKKVRSALKDLGLDYHGSGFSYKHRISLKLAKFLSDWI